MQLQASTPQPPCTSADLHHAGHQAAVLDLAACSARPGQVLSLSEDASARLWDVVEKTCLAVWPLAALSLVRVKTADSTHAGRAHMPCPWRICALLGVVQGG